MTDPNSNALQNAQTTIKSLEDQVKALQEQLKKVGISPKNESTKVASEREKTRLTKSTAKMISEDEGRIGGDFEIEAEPKFLDTRLKYFQDLYEVQQKVLAEKEKVPIKVTLPDGSIVDGKAWETSPLSIATGISPGLAKASIIAKVQYTKRVSAVIELGGEYDEEELQPKDSAFGELWDLSRPLEGDCKLQLLKFDDDEARTVFWHSSAHLMGQAIERTLGAHLTVGPPIEPGFYYDSYIGDNGICEDTLKKIEKLTIKLAKEKQEFQRLVMTKEEALEMFKDNPYKLSIIKNKVEEGGFTSAYRNGPFVDLCLGPHIVNTGAIKAVALKQATTAYWLGNENNDRLQRVTGVAFPDKKQLKEYKEFLKKAAENDHRKIGLDQELFFFDRLSPGCAFWKPHGGRLFMKLMSFMREMNRKGGYKEVVTPNVFSIDLWKISGHWKHYQKNMFTFTDGEHEDNVFALKPMNCPSHCVIFDHSIHSYRDLPLRLCDNGVLHRNEASGALTGLTRVRRFQQDDAHVYCRRDQVKSEVLSILELIRCIYDILGLKINVARSTRPAKAVGLVKENGEPDPDGVKLWDDAEAQLAEALDTFVGKGNWKDNPGDGAFYGPKIDIQVFDALNRKHQCATVQLDFQTPKRFNLKYTGSKSNEEGGSNIEQPVMIHRAIMGSFERMIGVLTEHYMGKWPFWLSPRQIMIIPVAGALNEYAQSLKDKLYAEDFDVEVDVSTKTLNKKILLAQREQYNYMFIVGDKEKDHNTVNIRTRRNNKLGEMSIDDVIDMMKKFRSERSLDSVVDPKPE